MKKLRKNEKWKKLKNMKKWKKNEIMKIERNMKNGFTRKILDDFQGLPLLL